MSCHSESPLKTSGKASDSRCNVQAPRSNQSSVLRQLLESSFPLSFLTARGRKHILQASRRNETTGAASLVCQSEYPPQTKLLNRYFTPCSFGLSILFCAFSDFISLCPDSFRFFSERQSKSSS